MNLLVRSIGKLTWVELKLFFREHTAAFFTLVFPLMMLFMFGSIYGNQPTPFFGGFGNVDISVPAYGAMIIATSGLITLPILIASYRERKILWRFRATPIHPLTIFAAQVVVLLIMNLFGMLLLVFAAKVVYHLRFAGNALSVLAAYFLCSLSFLALGFSLASLVSTARSAQIVGMVLFFPMIFLSGATIPREVLSQKILAIGKFLPLTPVVSILRGLWTGSSWYQFGGAWLYLGLLFIAGIVFSARFFRWE